MKTFILIALVVFVAGLIILRVSKPKNSGNVNGGGSSEGKPSNESQTT